MKKTTKLLQPKKAAAKRSAHLSPAEQAEDEAFATRRYNRNRTPSSSALPPSTTKNKA